MNVLLLGNGFDLYYKLPTKYSNFLHVASYLSSHQPLAAHSVGDILSQKAIQTEDPFIKECYETHKELFDCAPVDNKKIEELVAIIKSNKWFSFLLKSFSKDVGWIDFEKEISFVISCFIRILPEKGTSFQYKNNKDILYVVEHFDFLVDEAATRKSYTIGAHIIKKEFCVEHPIGSNNWNVSKEKVATYLSTELQKLAYALNLYLSCFVETTYNLLCKSKTFKQLPIFPNINQTVTFNYTSTFEHCYRASKVFHIHGSLGKDIVLGIQPDEADDVETSDTSFIAFKKYFQRTMYETDFEYLRWMSNIKSTKRMYRLIVMGHSLDITDKDIILDLFNNAQEVIVLYHSAEAKASYISNLIQLYGKDGFDSLRKEQALTFLSLDSDFSNLANQMLDEAMAEVIFDSESQDII